MPGIASDCIREDTPPLAIVGGTNSVARQGVCHDGLFHRTATDLRGSISAIQSTPDAADDRPNAAS